MLGGHIGGTDLLGSKGGQGGPGRARNRFPHYVEEDFFFAQIGGDQVVFVNRLAAFGQLIEVKATQ